MYLMINITLGTASLSWQRAILAKAVPRVADSSPGLSPERPLATTARRRGTALLQHTAHARINHRALNVSSGLCKVLPASKQSRNELFHNWWHAFSIEPLIFVWGKGAGHWALGRAVQSARKPLGARPLQGVVGHFLQRCRWCFFPPLWTFRLVFWQ